jgi:hypothetical protein
MNKTLLALATAALLAAGSASAADLVLLNRDAAGVGLNSTTPAAPVGGNPGTTRGAQATFVYEFAMKMWGSVLESKVPIKVAASFAPLTCTPTSGVLGSAGTYWILRLNDGTRDRYYGSALADSLLGYDAVPDPTNPEDISSRFNGILGDPGCLDGSGWYFGIDGHTPAGKINFLNVVMHEIGHGLGAQGFINKTSGAFLGGYSDAYTKYAYDNELNKRFEDASMTDAMRASAMKTPGRTVWTGPKVNAAANVILDNNFHESVLRATAPAAVVGNYGFYTAAFGPAASSANFNGQWVVAQNGAATDGCTAITNGAAVTGKIAIIDRGTCGFAAKVKNAQNAGAKAVVIANTSAGTWGAMGGADPTITIPSVIVQYADGVKFKANVPITGGMTDLPATKAGMDSAGRTRLYSPWVVATGSTFSHFDTTLHPNALMEPFDSPDVQAQYNVDLTPALFADIGWVLRKGGASFANCDTGTAASDAYGIVIGSNMAATNEACKSVNTLRNQYVSCMYKYRDGLLADGLIDQQQALKLNVCIKRQSDQFRR